MITQPSSARLLEVIRAELSATVAPQVSEPVAAAALGMIDFLLGVVTRRAASEVAWMREEIADIDQAAEALVGAGLDRDGQVAQMLVTLRDGRVRSDHLPEVQREYDLAGELLARALEVTVPLGPEAAAPMTDVLRRRLSRETAIRGEFLAAR